MNTILIETKQCPSCGKPMPSGALAGLCPACLLGQGAATEGEAGGQASFQPPPLAEIAKLFPQLEILGLLGAGGMGAVYKARQPALDRFVALKILPSKNAGGVNFAERFNREARALARLSHPNIVTVHEFGQAGGLHYFIMEFVDGANLRQLGKATRLSPREALQIIPQICDALQYAHDEGVVHRDIKPENVLVDRKGRVKIADFGLAKILGYDSEAARLTVEGQIMGTPHYMAPEQVERPLAVDHRADIYSLGVVFYEMLTGDLPLGKFPPPSSRARGMQIDVRFDEVVLRALENDPERRYQRANEVKTSLETISAATAPANATSSPAPAATGRRHLHWAGFPVVVEYDGEREVSWNGTLSAVTAAFFFVFIGFVLVRFITGASNHPGTLPICMMVAVLAVLAGVRRTLNQPPESELSRTPGGTVILPRKKRWNWQYLAFVGITAFVVGWTLFNIHWLGPQLRRWTGKALASQTARRDAQTGAFIAKLPGRGTVELLAVAEVGAAPNQWWRPDGTPITNTAFQIVKPAVLDLPDRKHRNLIFAWSDLPAGTDGPYYETMPDNASVAWGGRVTVEGKQRSAGQICAAWPDSPERALVRAGFAIEPWRTISTHTIKPRGDRYQTKPGDPQWRIVVHGFTDSRYGAQMTLMLRENGRDWRVKVVAIDTNGNPHDHTMASSTRSAEFPSALLPEYRNPNEQVSALWTYSFNELTLDNIREFQVQVRPIHWIEFPKIALDPTSPLPAPLPLKFTEVIERTFDELIDFDTGLTAEFPPGKPGEPVLAGSGENAFWAHANGFDAVAGIGELRILDATFAPLQDGDWDSLTPMQVLARHSQGTFKPRVLPAPAKSGDYRTFAYQTREGGFGLIQLVAFETKRAGATVRLKRVERASAKPCLRGQPDPQTGALVARLPKGGSISLLALKPGKAGFKTWQRADGSHASDLECAVDYSHRLSAVEARLFDVLFRLQNLPRPMDTPVFEFASAIRSAPGGKVESHGATDDTLLPVQVVWPLATESASARVGVPVAGWHTIRSFEPRSRSFSKTRIGDDPPWEIDVHTVATGLQGAQVTVVFGGQHPDWNLRVLATLVGGDDATGVMDAVVTTGPTTTKTYVFPGIALESVQNFQVQAQPLDWVELGNLNLASALETAQP